MSILQISNKPLPSECEVSASKSYANRALVLAAIANRQTVIKGLPDSSDVREMLNCLPLLGVKVEWNGSDCIVHGGFAECEKSQNEINLYAGQGGTTARFLTALVALGKNKYLIDTDEQLKSRPVLPLVQSLRNLGVKVDFLDNNNSFPLIVQGPYKVGNFTSVDCSQSTQFASALMMVADKAQIQLDLINCKFSLPYLQLTKKMIQNFPATYLIPADFSSASYVIAFASLNQDVLIPNIYEWDKEQADSKLLDILQKHGGKFEFTPNGLRILKSQLTAFDENVESCPDLVPTLVYLALFIQGESKLRQLKVLKYKESDRLAWILSLLQRLDSKYHYDHSLDCLTIYGANPLQIPSDSTLPFDHRIVMMMSLILKQLGGGKITNSDAVKKSFPNFFEIF